MAGSWVDYWMCQSQLVYIMAQDCYGEYSLLLNRAEWICLNSNEQLEKEMDTRLYTGSFQRPAD